jgi:hypothetical protein
MTSKQFTGERGSPIPESRRRRLELAVERYGVKRVIEATGVREQTLYRVLAKGSVYSCTDRYLTVGLDLLEREAQ